MRDVIVATPGGGLFGAQVGWVDTGIRTICAATMLMSFATIFLPTLANAVLRYTTNASLTWSVEIVQLTFPWFIMAGVVLAAQHGRHIGVQLLSGLMPGRAAVGLEIVVQVVILAASTAVVYVFLGFGLYDGGMEFAAGRARFTSLGVPQSWSYLALLFGYAMLGVTAATTILRMLAGGPVLRSNESV